MPAQYFQKPCSKCDTELAFDFVGEVKCPQCGTVWVIELEDSTDPIDGDEITVARMSEKK